MSDKELMKLAMEVINDDNTEDTLEMNENTNNQDKFDEAPFDAEHFTLDTELIRVRLKEQKCTVKQLHEQLGVAYRTVTRWLSRDEFPLHENLTCLAEALQVELHDLVIRKGITGKDPAADNIRFVQRRIENIVTEILDDEKVPNDKKIDALVKFHGVLIKTKNSRRRK